MKIFPGNYDKNTIVENDFSSIIFARFVRVHPVNANNKPAMRVEYKGCSMGESDLFTAGMSQARLRPSCSYESTGRPKKYISFRIFAIVII